MTRYQPLSVVDITQLNTYSGNLDAGRDRERLPAAPPVQTNGQGRTMLGRGDVRVCERHDDFWDCFFCKKTLPFDAISCSRCGAYSMGDNTGRETWHSGRARPGGILVRIGVAGLVIAALVAGTLVTVGALDNHSAADERCAKSGDCMPLIMSMVASDAPKATTLDPETGASVLSMHVGACLHYEDGGTLVRVVSCDDDHDGRVSTTVPIADQCPVGTDAVVSGTATFAKFCIEDGD